MNPSKSFSLLAVCGIELEYAIISREDGRTLPLSDKILVNSRGKVTNSRKFGPCRVSNELALHVLELKTPEPVASLSDWGDKFLETLQILDSKLKPLGAMLMPTAMHPCMQPEREARLWPHGDQEIYRAYHQIFDCLRHGWCNVQSCHLNLSFCGDNEFKRLHNAVIVLLPLLPALSASSPFVEGKRSEYLDARLDFYQHNQARCPSIAGNVIPESVNSQAEYHSKILQPMYAQIAELYPQAALLQEEWLNSRAAITHFQRGSVEIRELDLQECPMADLAICDYILNLLRHLVALPAAKVEPALNGHSINECLQQWRAVVRSGMNAQFQLPEILPLFDLADHPIQTVADFWENLWAIKDLRPANHLFSETVKTLIFQGNLASRMQLAVSANPDKSELQALIFKLNRCLMSNTLFHADED